jgi:hypothetical protein
MAEQVDTIEVERRPNLADLLDKALHPPKLWIIRAIGLATPQLIIEDDWALVGEALK